ncbi:hypothetical protein LCGC14_1357530, partial [marine sediment metagenome]
TWWRPKEGAIVHGRLMGRHERNTGKKQAFYQIKLISSASGIQGKGDDAEVVELEKGGILNVNETKALQCLHPLTADDGIYDVFIKVLEKVAIEGGHSFWRMMMKKKTLRAATFVPDISGSKEAVRDTNYDDIPF